MPNLPTSYTLSDQALRNVLDSIANVSLSSAGLVIKAGGGVLVKAGTLSSVMANGVLVSIPANTDMPALVGTVATATYNVFVFSVNSAGVFTTQMGTAGATLGAVVFPVIPVGNTIIGFVVIHPTGTGSFVGGTTALDDATVVPNAVYTNTTYPFNPNVVANVP